MRDEAQHVDQHLLAGVLHQLLDAHVLEPHAHLAAVPVRACLDVRAAQRAFPPSMDGLIQWCWV